MLTENKKFRLTRLGKQLSENIKNFVGFYI